MRTLHLGEIESGVVAAALVRLQQELEFAVNGGRARQGEPIRSREYERILEIIRGGDTFGAGLLSKVGEPLKMNPAWEPITPGARLFPDGPDALPSLRGAPVPADSFFHSTGSATLPPAAPSDLEHMGAPSAGYPYRDREQVTDREQNAPREQDAPETPDAPAEGTDSTEDDDFEGWDTLGIPTGT